MKKKEIQTWKTTFEGHDIKVTNSGKAKLYIDGELVTKERGLFHLAYTLIAPIPNTDYYVRATLDGAKEAIVTCELFVGKKVPMEFGREDQDGNFTKYTEEEIKKMKEDAEAAILITTIL